MGKIYLFLTPSKTDGRVPSQKGAPTTCNLIYWEFSQQTYVQTLLASLDVVKARKSVLPSPSQQEFAWRTNILRNTSIGCPCKKWIRAASNFIALYTISVNSWNVGKFFRSLILKDCIKVQVKKKKSCCLVFPSSTKRKIRHFHVVVAQRRLKNVQKKPDMCKVVVLLI